MLKLKAMLNDERGQTLALTALGMSMLLAFTALALDTGVLFTAKRRLQIVAERTRAARMRLHGRATAAGSTRGASTWWAVPRRCTPPTPLHRRAMLRRGKIRGAI